MKVEAATGFGFRRCVEAEYDPKALNAAFKESWLAGVLVNRILRRE